MGKVIPARVWRHKSGMFGDVSVYGAAPFGEGWEIVQKGWTIEHPDGTVGIGRAPFSSEEEAAAWIAKHPNFPGMNQG